MAVVISVVIAAVATYVTTGLKYGRVVEARADRLAAADGGLRYAIERLENSDYAGCLSNLGNTGYTIDFPVQVNGADVKVTCTKGAERDRRHQGLGDHRHRRRRAARTMDAPEPGRRRHPEAARRPGLGLRSGAHATSRHP